MSNTEIIPTGIQNVRDHYLSRIDGNLPVSPLDNRLDRLYQHYSAADEASFLEPAAEAAALDNVFVGTGVATDSLTRRQTEAFGLAFPELPLQSISSCDEDTWHETFRCPWRAAVYDVAVRDILNSGGHVGDLRIDAGSRVAILPGVPLTEWRLATIGRDGKSAAPFDEDEISVILHVKRALLKFPDLRVLSGEEATIHMRNVLEGGSLEKDDVEGLLNPLEDLMEGPFESIAARVVPVLPFVVIAAGEGTRVLTGRRSFGEALSSAARRSVRPGVPAAVGGLLLMLGAGIVSIPVALFTHLGMSRLSSTATVSDRVAARFKRLEKLRRQ